jgi:hypothetical protein
MRVLRSGKPIIMYIGGKLEYPWLNQTLPRRFLGYFCVSEMCVSTMEAEGKPAFFVRRRYDLTRSYNVDPKLPSQVTTIISRYGQLSPQHHVPEASRWGNGTCYPVYQQIASKIPGIKLCDKWQMEVPESELCNDMLELSKSRALLHIKV